MSELIAFIGVGIVALEICNKFCEEGNDTKDFSAISKVGGAAWIIQ